MLDFAPHVIIFDIDYTQPTEAHVINKPEERKLVFWNTLKTRTILGLYDTPLDTQPENWDTIHEVLMTLSTMDETAAINHTLPQPDGSLIQTAEWLLRGRREGVKENYSIQPII